MKESLQVVILGQTFTVRSEASPEEVQRVAAFVNQQLAEVAGGRTADSLHAALLALLNVAEAYLRLRDGGAHELQGLEERLSRLLQRVEKETPRLPACSQNAGAGPAQASLCLET